VVLVDLVPGHSTSDIVRRSATEPAKRSKSSKPAPHAKA
jgi:hypothetical protein